MAMQSALLLCLLISIASLRAEAFSPSQKHPDHTTTKHSGTNGGDARREFLRKFVGGSAGMLVSSLVPVVSHAKTAKVVSSPFVVPTPPITKATRWPLGKIAFSLLPLSGTSTRRATVEETIQTDVMWTHDQIQGIVNVNVPVRQTVVKLSEKAGGGLWVHNPVAPTPQLLQMMNDLEEKHGPVRHIVLGTVALEHKATFGAFARHFPKATVWIQPGQWSFPLQLPIDALGVTQRGARLREIPSSGATVPTGRIATSDLYEFFAEKEPVPEWAVDFDWESLGPLKFQSVGGFSETAFLHKPSRTLLVTDAVVSVTEDPPKIIQEDPRALLFHARDSIKEIVQDTPETRRKGWRRMVEFGLIFFPSQIDVVSVAEALQESREVDSSMSNLGDGAVPFNLYPWKWRNGDADKKNFDAISKNGKLFCPPILTKLILDRETQKTLAWVDRVANRFDFEHIISCHLNNNVKATPKEFRDAFDCLRSTANDVRPQRPLAEDLALLQKASDLLTTYGVVGPSQVCDGEPARILGRFADQGKV